MRPIMRLDPCRSALNRVRGMPFEWSLNPYTGCAHQCTFCYVRAFEKRADRPWGDAYGTSVRVKTNVAQVLDQELARRVRPFTAVVVGAATDPYQPLEGRFRLTRACLEVFAKHGHPFGIITRGPLVVRDLDVLVDAARRARVGVTLSVPTLREDVWRATEPGTAPPRARLRAVRRLAEAGLRVSVALAPILPGLSDHPDDLGRAVRAARDAGARKLWTNLLYLRPGTREHFLEHLARDFPAELARYEKLYAGRAHLSPRDRAEHERRFADATSASPARLPLAPLISLDPTAAEAPRFAEQLGFAL